MMMKMMMMMKKKKKKKKKEKKKEKKKQQQQQQHHRTDGAHVSRPGGFWRVVRSIVTIELHAGAAWGSMEGRSL
jgi:hypothetical protein